MPVSVPILLSAIPLIPDGDDARRLAEEELAKAVYQAARPTLVDRWARAIVDAVSRLFTTDGAAALGPGAAIAIGIVLAAVLVAVLVVWGRPRRSRTGASPAILLGAADDRTAARLRDDADRAAASEDWAAAIVLRYRALARGLLERDLIAPAPGATAQTIAREAAVPFPAVGEKLHGAAVTFDEVRYLGVPGDADRYRAVVAIDDRVARMRPEEAAPADAAPAAREWRA
ncbi:DUF4129 domain-containing protein [uncultured Microbacterium sp.]|uniref:DUF4129 domain-containing protein n=1 Tax=uncultured Microbacterium sp. TaxID=191216 RepID=UPI0025E1DFC4|nr:DUF4129 domain-containing protein [uncultured Microbacterium sp.]